MPSGRNSDARLPPHIFAMTLHPRVGKREAIRAPLESAPFSFLNDGIKTLLFGRKCGRTIMGGSSLSSSPCSYIFTYEFVISPAAKCRVADYGFSNFVDSSQILFQRKVVCCIDALLSD